MARTQEQAELIYKLGLLFGPLYDTVNNPQNHTQQTRTRVAAAFVNDSPAFFRSVRNFTEGEVGYDYGFVMDAVHLSVYQLHGKFQHAAILHDSVQLKQHLNDTVERVKSAILSIPTDAIGVFDANTPFATYTYIKNLIQTTSTRLVYIDRYLQATVFYRYLFDLANTTNVTLITWEEFKRKKQEWLTLMDISRLYAAERTVSHYRLMTTTQIHDRWLVLDDRLFSLGGSIAEAGHGNDFTLTEIPAIPANLAKVDSVINNAVELFGINHPMHP